MFKNLFKFSYKRNFKEAVGFYIAYLVLIMLVGMVLSVLLGVLTGNQDNYEFGVNIGVFTAVVACLSLSYLILKNKNLLGNFSYILLSLVSGLLAYFGGGIFGLIPVCFLSTRPRIK